MYIRTASDPTARHRACCGRSNVRLMPQGLGGLHGTHSASQSFPDPNECWRPGSVGKPDLNKTLFTVEAALEIPAACTGSIIAKTTLRDSIPGGASLWADSIRFGVSDGTNIGGLEKATRVSETEGVVEFATQIQWAGNSCIARNDVFVYVKYLHPQGPFTFIEVGFYPRVSSDKGVPADRSLKPAIRLNPCNHLTPIRSPYIQGKESEWYLKLPPGARRQVNKETDSLFRDETGIARKLDLSKPADRLLSHHWLRIRDSVTKQLANF
jgi:hypothetical protein